MQTSPTLYKIRNVAASEDSIVLETCARVSQKHPHLLFCGGFHSSMQGTKATFLANFCQLRGWGFTRFDYRGHGASEGQAEFCSLHDWLADTLCVLDEIPGRVMLVGSSMGAWLAVHACLQRPEKINALVTIAAAPDFTTNLLWKALDDRQRQAIDADQCISIPTHYEGEDWRLRKTLFDSGKALSLLNNADSLAMKIPVHMLHGTADEDVPWTFSQCLLEKFSESPSANLTLIRGADHRLSDENCLTLLRHTLERMSEEIT